MASYDRSEARDWAREHFKGVVNVIIPSFTNDLKSVNEAAIRHDVRMQRKHGFAGALLVSEVTITQQEYREFCEIAFDEAAGRQIFVHHSSWSDYETAVRGLKIAEEAGAELVLLSYPPNFYPQSEQDIYNYSRAVCEATSLGVMLFPVGLWGFSDRIHPSDVPVSLIRRLIDDCPNIVAIKAEGGYPSTFMGTIECWRRFGEEVVISCPIEGHLIPLAQLMPIQVSATNDSEYYGPTLPRIFDHLQAGEYDEATEIFWQTHPARKAKDALAAEMHGTGFLNRQAWKFQAWLQGYNGGPLRAPTLRIHDKQMNALRKGLRDAGLAATEEPNSAFFVGRNPTEIPKLPRPSRLRPPSAAPMAAAPYFVPSDAVEAVLSWPDAIAALRTAYMHEVDSVSAPRRTVAAESGAWLRALPAVPPQARYFGAKLMGLARTATDPGVEYVTVLFDRQTSKIAAFLDASLITAYRTAATSAAALDILAPAGTARLGVLGSGLEATMHARAFASVRTLEKIKVFSPTPAHREAFAAKLGAELEISCEAVDSAEEAVAGATVALAAARAREELPILFGHWLQPGTTVVSIGSTVPSQREVDVTVLDRADLIICDALLEVLEESGDMLEATKAGVPIRHKTHSLGDLLRGELEELRRTALNPLFKSVGGGFQDVVLGQLVFEEALAAGLARPLPMEFAHKSL